MFDTKHACFGGTAALLAELRAPEFLAREDVGVVLEESGGPVSCTVRHLKGEAPRASFVLPRLPEFVEALGAPAAIAAALGLAPADDPAGDHEAGGDRRDHGADLEAEPDRVLRADLPAEVRIRHVEPLVQRRVEVSRALHLPARERGDQRDRRQHDRRKRRPHGPLGSLFSAGMHLEHAQHSVSLSHERRSPASDVETAR